MAAFPIFLDLEGRACLVVGAGAVGRDKARHLALAGADVLMIDPSPPQGFLELAGLSTRLRILARPFRDEDCEGRVLVFACTGRREVDDAVEAAARARGALVCRSGCDGAGDFTTGAVVERGDLCIAVSTAGQAPALASVVRDRVAGLIGTEYGQATAMMASLRTRLRTAVADRTARAEALREAARGGLVDALGRGSCADAEALLEEIFRKACGNGATPSAAVPVPAAEESTEPPAAQPKDSSCTR